MGNVVTLEIEPDIEMTMQRFKACVNSADLTDAMLIGHYPGGELAVISVGMDRKDALWLIKEAESHTLYPQEGFE